MQSEPSPKLESSFVQQIATELIRFCGPIFITPGLMTYPSDMIDSGTYSLIDTGRKRLLVTCHHVWQEYLENLKTNPDTTLGLNLGDGNSSIAFACPERQIIDADPELDLVVFAFDPAQIRANNVAVRHKKEWFPIGEWPIAHAQEGSYLVLMGFSGEQSEKKGTQITFMTQPVPLKVSGIGLKQIAIFNESENQEVFGDIKNSLGGFSGSPAYTLGEKGSSLVGFVKSGYKQSRPLQVGPQPDSVFAGSLFLTHASFLNPDGTLARQR
jgi:hypothetical protein